MEIALLLVIIVLVILIKNNLSENREANNKLARRVEEMRKEIIALHLTVKTNQSIISKETEHKPLQKTEDFIKPSFAENITPKIIVEKEIEEIKEDIKEKIEAINLRNPAPPMPDFGRKSNDIYSHQIKPQVQESWFEKWVKNNPDIEKFIGENLINKIGIAVLVLGIAFFVKYAIDQDWIKEGGRVAIGILCGGILIGVAHWLRNSYRSFSSVLVGGGLTIFYFTIAFAYHQYKMMDTTTAFAMMIVITAFAIALSVLYNKIELAILAAIGGFVTPFLVSNGSGNYVALFTYLCILNAGIIVLAYLKQWRVLQIIAFAFTILIYGTWLSTSIDTPKYSTFNALLFATLFYAMFVAMSLLYHVKKHYSLKAIDFIIFLLINLGFFAAGITILSHQNLEQYKGLFTSCVAATNLIIGYVLFKNSLIDKKFIFLIIGVTLSFISLIGPIQLEGNYITLFWCTEMVLLFWLYQKSNIGLFKTYTPIVSFLAIISLFIDWSNVYSYPNKELLIIFNKGFIASIFAASSLFVTGLLLKKEANTYFIKSLLTSTVKRVYQTASVLILFIGGFIEIWYQFTSHYPSLNIYIIYLLLYTYGFVIVLSNVCKKLIQQIVFKFYVVATTAMFILFLFSASAIYNTLLQMLTSGKNQIHFVGYLVCCILLIVLFATTIIQLKEAKSGEQSLSICSSLIVVELLGFISIFCFHLYVWIMFSNLANLSNDENNFERAGLSIIWGISSFIIMWLGMRNSNKLLRVIALVVFGITLLKLFFFDISNMSPGGKIAAFTLLGVLLLVISFMYQRLKKILTDQPTKAPDS